MIRLEQRHWGDTPSNEAVFLFRLTNDSGAYVEFTNLGASWVSAVMPARDGTYADVLLGYQDLDGYLNDSCYMGCTVGRFANRIKNARFSIGGVTYLLEANEGLNSIHGGYSGLAKKVWAWEETSAGVCFTVFSPDGEGGYPGNLKIRVEYVFSEDNTLQIRYWATSDRDTFLNLNNHAYFNLHSDYEPIYGHQLCINSTEIVETDSSFIPTGRYIPVEGTPFDFKEAHAIGKSIHLDNQQLQWNRGYNHCYVLKKEKSNVLEIAAQLSSDDTGRILSVKTDLPGILLYTGGFLESKYPGRKGKKIKPNSGVCLESQFFPDTPSHPHFPSCLLQADEEYLHTIVYCFATR